MPRPTPTADCSVANQPFEHAVVSTVNGPRQLQRHKSRIGAVDDSLCCSAERRARLGGAWRLVLQSAAAAPAVSLRQRRRLGWLKTCMPCTQRGVAEKACYPPSPPHAAVVGRGPLRYPLMRTSRKKRSTSSGAATNTSVVAKEKRRSLRPTWLVHRAWFRNWSFVTTQAPVSAAVWIVKRSSSFPRGDQAIAPAASSATNSASVPSQFDSLSVTRMRAAGTPACRQNSRQRRTDRDRKRPSYR
eukprot:scaffold16426_cov109-Isochrysis_galbana.AAC.5